MGKLQKCFASFLMFLCVSDIRTSSSHFTAFFPVTKGHSRLVLVDFSILPLGKAEQQTCVELQQIEKTPIFFYFLVIIGSKPPLIILLAETISLGVKTNDGSALVFKAQKNLFCQSVMM